MYYQREVINTVNKSNHLVKFIILLVLLLLIGVSFNPSTGIKFEKNSGFPTNQGGGGPAYCINDPSGELMKGPVYVNLYDPDDIRQISTGDINVTGGFYHGTMYTWYVCDEDGCIWSIDDWTGESKFIGMGEEGLTGLAYVDYSCNVYGCSKTDLYIINLYNGTQTHVGSFNISGGGHMICIGYSHIGLLFGIDMITDCLYWINHETAETYLIGPLGIDVNGTSDLDYEIDDQCLYLITYTTQGELYICDIYSGTATLVGAFQDGAHITGLGISTETGNPTPVAVFEWTPEIPQPGETVEFNASKTHLSWGEGEVDIYEWDWDSDGEIDESTTNPITYHSWDNYGDYKVTLLVKLICLAHDTTTHTVHIHNHRPNKPTIDGPKTGRKDIEYDFNLVATDPDNHIVSYIVDWGDSTTSESDYYTSGYEVTLSHKWQKIGIFPVKAKTKDLHGAESDWSDPLVVTIPRNRAYVLLFFQLFFERFPLIEEFVTWIREY
jgi:hypothetical protein